jgi:hypothetical protein
MLSPFVLSKSPEAVIGVVAFSRSSSLLGVSDVPFEVLDFDLGGGAPAF